MTTCVGCGEEFSEVGIHWRHSPECRPEFTEKQMQILKGLLMGDGSLHTSSKNACIAAEMANKEYLEHLHSIFSVLSTEPCKKHTAEESAKRTRESGFRKNAKAENYQDKYYWNTRRHPQLNKFKKWYNENGKEWPENLKLTPLTLKHLYAGDGSLEQNKNQGLRLHIAMNNERKNKQKIENYFRNASLPSPDYWCENDSGGVERCKARWYKENAFKLFDYMGGSVPGFEYKWPN